MYLENRLISMLDILGMSSKIKDRKGIEDLLGKYRVIIEGVEQEIRVTHSSMENRPDLAAYHFEVSKFVFDTIVIVSKPLDQKDSWWSFCSAISQIMMHFAQNGM